MKTEVIRHEMTEVREWPILTEYVMLAVEREILGLAMERIEEFLIWITLELPKLKPSDRTEKMKWS